MRTIKFNAFFTGADTDILNDTELETMPGMGLLTVRACSTVNTATLDIQSPSQPSTSRARAIQIRANGEIRAYDSAWVLSVDDDERVTIGLAGTTGTVQVEATWVGN